MVSAVCHIDDATDNQAPRKQFTAELFAPVFDFIAILKVSVY